jgi:hypothetical protein
MEENSRSACSRDARKEAKVRSLPPLDFFSASPKVRPEDFFAFLLFLLASENVI